MQKRVKRASLHTNQKTVMTTYTDMSDTDEDTYHCDTCDTTFEQKHDLIQHIKNAASQCIPLKHYTYSEIKQKPTSRKKQFWCEICMKQFRDSSDIARHRRKHTGEKPYACDICCKHFAQLCVLNRHKLIHSDDKPFKCDLCVKQFRTSSDLGKHKRIHVKTVSRDICEREVGETNEMENHRQRSNCEKPYSCKICKKKFAVLRYLTKHQKRIHS